MEIKIKLSEIEPETLTAISKWVAAAVPKKWGQLSKIGFCKVDTDEKKKIFREPIGTEYFTLLWGGEEIGEARVYDPELANNCKAMREAIGRAVSFARHRKRLVVRARGNGRLAGGGWWNYEADCSCHGGLSRADAVEEQLDCSDGGCLGVVIVEAEESRSPFQSCLE